MAAVIAIGLLFSIFEHTVPLRKFQTDAAKLASGAADQLQPSRFRGLYRRIAADLNDGIDKVAASSGGQSRKATNLEDVLGDLPAQPQMAAFAVPGGDDSGLIPPSSGGFQAPMGGVALPQPSGGGFPAPPGRGALPQPPGARPAPPSPVSTEDEIEGEWRGVFDAFVATKNQCGESLDGFTYEKFRKTLVKNRDALVARHGVSRVKFAVYIKEGKAALKASPVKE